MHACSGSKIKTGRLDDAFAEAMLKATHRLKAWLTTDAR